jgi:hypothetical protein
MLSSYSDVCDFFLVGGMFFFALKLKIQSSNFDNLKKFLFKVATTIMNGHQRFLPGKL